MRAPLFTTALMAVTSAMLAACQGLPVSSAPDAERDDPMLGAPPITKGLDAAGLNALLLAEIAGQRGDYDRAARGYLEAAERYRSTALIERAALGARFSEDPELLETISQRWRELAPSSDAPIRLLASLSLQRGDWLASLEQRLALVARGEHGELADFAEQAIADQAPLAPLLARLRRHLAEGQDLGHPHYHDAILATALLEAASGEASRAEARLAELAETHPELPALWLVRARLALEREDPAAARRTARRGLEASPDDGRFILLLAQAELKLGNPRAAEAQTDSLLARHDDNPTLRLALARLYLDEGLPAPARRLLLPLVDEDDTPPAAFTLLGAAAEAEGNVDNALLYYRQVPVGDQFLGARLRAADMLIEADRLSDAREFLRLERLRHIDQAEELTAMEVELLDQQGRVDEASALLERALAERPDDEGLRYLHAMRAFQAGDLATMERDLHRLIEQDPDNATALNALGYTLADTTERYAEARELIERAHRLDPDNAAILDSLGWVLHKQGDHRRALPYLQRAHAAMPDQEVAAHLAEVLWALDRTAEARALVEESLERYDEHPRIDDLLRRLPALAP